MKIIRFVGLGIGLTMVALLMRETGWEPVKAIVRLLGWGYAVVLVYPLSWILFNTLGWRCTLPTEAESLPVLSLAQIRLAGETFNSLLPSGYVGGEPLKAKLLSRYVPLREAASSVLIAKSAQSVALVCFVTLGLTVGHVAKNSLLAQKDVLIAVAFLTIGIGLFTWMLARPSFYRLGRWLHGLTRLAWLERQAMGLRALDDSLGLFYRERKGRFIASIFWHLAGWLAGALEVAVIFFLVGQPVLWRQAWFIGAMGQLAAVVGLMSPAGIGFYEGGHTLAASLLGLPPSMGLSVSLIRRVREVFWDGVGLGLFWKLSKTTAARRGK